MALDKRDTERLVAQEFLDLYNSRFGTKYEIAVHGDSPDFQCTDPKTGKLLNLEVTLLEELPGFIDSALTGRPRPVSPYTGTEAISFRDEGFPLVEEQIRKKLQSAYGPSTALVLKHVTPFWGERDWRHFRTLRGQDLFADVKRRYGAGIWSVCTDNSPWPSISIIVRLDADNDGLPVPAD